MSVTRRIGQTLSDSIASGRSVALTLAPSSAPANSFENLASYSSQGGGARACVWLSRAVRARGWRLPPSSPNPAP